MGIQAMFYRWKKLAAATQARDELEFYTDLPLPLASGPRPCYCEWSLLKAELLGNPPPDAPPCACAGPVPFVVPGYQGRDQGDRKKMRQFVLDQIAECPHPLELRWATHERDEDRDIAEVEEWQCLCGYVRTPDKPQCCYKCPDMKCPKFVSPPRPFSLRNQTARFNQAIEPHLVKYQVNDKVYTNDSPITSLLMLVYIAGFILGDVSRQGFEVDDIWMEPA